MNKIEDEECKAILSNTKYLSNLDLLNSSGGNGIYESGFGMTWKPSEVINENMKYFQSLKEINLTGKN